MLIIIPDVQITRRIRQHMLVNTEARAVTCHRDLRELFEHSWAASSQPMYIFLEGEILSMKTETTDPVIAREVKAEIDNSSKLL